MPQRPSKRYLPPERLAEGLAALRWFGPREDRSDVVHAWVPAPAGLTDAQGDALVRCGLAVTIDTRVAWRRDDTWHRPGRDRTEFAFGGRQRRLRLTPRGRALLRSWIEAGEV